MTICPLKLRCKRGPWKVSKRAWVGKRLGREWVSHESETSVMHSEDMFPDGCQLVPQPALMTGLLG